MIETNEPTYEPNSVDPYTVAAFDTDMTMEPARGPVPLAHVIELRNDPTVSVWATGFNQALRGWAGIPGMAELKALTDYGPDDPDAPAGEWFVERPTRMRLLERVYPDAERYFVVDDVDLTELEPDWEYHTPWDYARDVLEIDIDGSGPTRPPFRFHGKT